VTAVYAPKVVLQLPLKEPARLADFVERCLRDDVALIAVVGDGCEAVEDEIDEIVTGDGSDDSRFITTSSHPGEPLEEVLEFAEFWLVEGRDGVSLVRL
jgi:hypothetical protein